MEDKKSKISLMIVDDHVMVRMGLKSLLEQQPGIRVVGDASSGEEALRKAAKVRPEIVIIDLMMPGMDGVETTRRFSSAFPETKSLILTTFGTAEGISQALDAGAKGAVLKSASLRDLTDSIHKVARGEIAISDEIANILSVNPPIEPLSPRQQEVLESLVRGLSNDEIAKQLEISKPVVKEHINILYRKLGAANRSEAIGIALRKHLLKD